MLAIKIAFKYFAEKAIGWISSLHLQSTVIEIRFELIEEYPKTTSPAPPLHIKVNVSASDNAPFDLMNLLMKSSLSVTSASNGGNAEIILGYSSINSNRISIAVEATAKVDIEPIAFSAKYLKAILMANKGSKSSSLKISSKGLSHVAFVDGDYTSNYYLVEIK